jgi:hypothetical protein
MFTAYLQIAAPSNMHFYSVKFDRYISIYISTPAAVFKKTNVVTDVRLLTERLLSKEGLHLYRNCFSQ